MTVAGAGISNYEVQTPSIGARESKRLEVDLKLRPGDNVWNVEAAGNWCPTRHVQHSGNPRATRTGGLPDFPMPAEELGFESPTTLTIATGGANRPMAYLSRWRQPKDVVAVD